MPEAKGWPRQPLINPTALAEGAGPHHAQRPVSCSVGTGCHQMHLLCIVLTWLRAAGPAYRSCGGGGAFRLRKD
ncbi:hypothetical protein GCM10027456_20630 [Kineosporia babensis]